MFEREPQKDPVLLSPALQPPLSYKEETLWRDHENAQPEISVQDRQFARQRFYPETRLPLLDFFIRSGALI
jgi:hypothetical protein